MVLSLQYLVFYIYRTCEFGLARFQELGSRIWLATTLLCSIESRLKRRQLPVDAEKLGGVGDSTRGESYCLVRRVK